MHSNKVMPTSWRNYLYTSKCPVSVDIAAMIHSLLHVLLMRPWQQSYGGKILVFSGGIGTIAGFHLLEGAEGKLPHPPHRPQTLALFKVVPRQMNYYANKN